MGLGRINVHAGDFKKGLVHQYLRGSFVMKGEGKFFRESIPCAQLETLELATEEAVISLGGAAGWGLAGGVLLGPVGLLAGLVLGGKSKEVSFICAFKDGRKFLGSADDGVFNQIKKDHLSKSF